MTDEELRVALDFLTRPIPACLRAECEAEVVRELLACREVLRRVEFRAGESLDTCPECIIGYYDNERGPDGHHAGCALKARIP